MVFKRDKKSIEEEEKALKEKKDLQSKKYNNMKLKREIEEEKWKAFRESKTGRSINKTANGFTKIAETLKKKSEQNKNKRGQPSNLLSQNKELPDLLGNKNKK